MASPLRPAAQPAPPSPSPPRPVYTRLTNEMREAIRRYFGEDEFDFARLADDEALRLLEIQNYDRSLSSLDALLERIRARLRPDDETGDRQQRSDALALLNRLPFGDAPPALHPGIKAVFQRNLDLVLQICSVLPQGCHTDSHVAARHLAPLSRRVRALPDPDAYARVVSLILDQIEMFLDARSLARFRPTAYPSEFLASRRKLVWALLEDLPFDTGDGNGGGVRGILHPILHSVLRIDLSLLVHLCNRIGDSADRLPSADAVARFLRRVSDNIYGIERRLMEPLSLHQASVIVGDFAALNDDDRRPPEPSRSTPARPSPSFRDVVSLASSYSSSSTTTMTHTESEYLPDDDGGAMHLDDVADLDEYLGGERLTLTHSQAHSPTRLRPRPDIPLSVG